MPRLCIVQRSVANERDTRIRQIVAAHSTSQCLEVQSLIADDRAMNPEFQALKYDMLREPGLTCVHSKFHTIKFQFTCILTFTEVFMKCTAKCF